MKKKLLLAALMIVSSTIFANNVELKLGADIFRDTTRDQYDDKTTSLDPGYSIGLEYIIDTDSNLSYGFGTEYKSQIKGNHGYDAHSTVPVYVLGRYGLENDFYLVGRAGLALNSSEGDQIDDTDNGVYLGLGVGTELTERLNVELLYEGSDYEYETAAGDVDGWYNVVSVKLSIKLGKDDEEVEVIEPIQMTETVETVEVEYVAEPVVELEAEPVVSEEVEAVVETKTETVVEAVEQETVPVKDFAAYLEGFSLRPKFAVNDFSLSQEDREDVEEMSKLLQGREGTLMLTGHTDDTGSEAYNLELSEKRANAVKDEFELYLQDENIEVMADGAGESTPVADNSTEEGRAENRRVEVKFEEK